MAKQRDKQETTQGGTALASTKKIRVDAAIKLGLTSYSVLRSPAESKRVRWCLRLKDRASCPLQILASFHWCQLVSVMSATAVA